LFLGQKVRERAWGWVALTGLFWAVPLVALAPATSELPTLDRPAYRPIVVRWQAKTVTRGTTFLLLRGDSPARLVLVSEIPAALGAATYRFEDSRALAADTVYELRIIGPDGTEIVLKTVLCRPLHDLRPLLPATAWTGLSQPAILTAWTTVPGPFAACRPGESATATPPAPERQLPDPPPRA